MIKKIKFILILFVLVSCLGFHFINHKGAVSNTMILFLNSNSRYGVGINKQSFWSEMEFHDTLIISDYSYNILLSKHFELLKDTVLFGGNDYLRYGAAFIMQYSNGSRDTFYSDPSLYYWKNEKGSEYVDNSGFFSRTFRGFFIYD